MDENRSVGVRSLCNRITIRYRLSLAAIVNGV